MKCNNPKCNNEVTTNRRLYCSKNCQAIAQYHLNKDKYKQYRKTGYERNPEGVKAQRKRAVDKFRTEKRTVFNKLIMKSYHKHKDRWNSRDLTHDVINCKRKPSGIIKECNNCGTTDELSLKFEIYPTKAAEIRQAITDGKIYYVCKECRGRK